MAIALRKDHASAANPYAAESCGCGAHLALFLQEEQLREDGDGLQVDREGPDHLKKRPVVLIDQNTEHRTWRQQVLDGEGVSLGVVAGLLRGAKAQHVNDGERGADEADFERIVVQ